MENANAGAVESNLGDDLMPKMGDNMQPQSQEPTVQTAETTAKVEDTTINNEEKRPEAKAEEGGDSKQEASRVINELGESRKKVLEKFIESAKKSGVVAEELKELISQDKALEKTIKSKFGNDYDALMRGDLTKPEAPINEEEKAKEYEKMKRKASLEAKLEVMKEETERIKTKQLEVFAQSNALNSEELEALKENAELLSEKYDYEDALSKALLIVNRDKAVAGNTFQPPTGGREKPATAISNDNPILNTYKKHLPERDLTQVARNLEEVSKNIQRDDFGNESFSITI